MKIAAAQLRAVPGDVEANLVRHERALEFAAGLGAESVIFPELSLTGYEPARAAHLAAQAHLSGSGPDMTWPTAGNPGSAALRRVQAACDRLGVIAAVGMPWSNGEHLHIGMFWHAPGERPLVYAKRHLHADEEPFFKPSPLGQLLLELPGASLAPAICYESLLDSHAAQAAELGADTYLASVAKSARGVERARAHYAEIARRHRMRVLMANAVGASDAFVSAGQSAAWDTEGRLLAELPATVEGLLLLDTRQNQALAHNWPDS
jgi:predicted amidohydrolase